MNTRVMGSWRCQFCHNIANNVSRMIAGDSVRQQADLRRALDALFGQPRRDYVGGKA
jgi:hypothetical protein